MSADTSVRRSNEAAGRLATTLMRATSGTSATLLAPPATADGSDANQLGLVAPAFQSLVLAPVIFRKARAIQTENAEPRYELLVSAEAVLPSVGSLQLNSVDSLFSTANGVVVGGQTFRIESWAASEALGQTYLYRLLLRVAEPQSSSIQS